MAATHGTPPSAVAIGTIVNTHGIRGELRLHPYNPSTTALRAGMAVTLSRGADSKEVTVSAIRPHKRVLLVTIEGVESATAAEALVGYELRVPFAELPPLPAGNVYHFELVGLDVVTTSGAHLGSICEVFTTGASDVCVVRHGDGREILVPFIQDIVKEVDVAGGRLVIEPMPGLLDE